MPYETAFPARATSKPREFLALFLITGLSLFIVGILGNSAHSAALMPPAVTEFFKAYCLDCHGPKTQKGDFRVDELKLSATTADAENWQLVLDNLHLGEMPPQEAKQPKPADVQPVTTWIESELKRAALELGGQKDEVVLRRLNRYEYENTIQDLFDVRGDYAVGFPEDASSGGFNNNGAALSLSAEQMDQYLRAADFILSRAIVTKPRPETKSVTFTLLDIEARKIAREAERAASEKSKGDGGYTETPAERKKRMEREAAGNTGRPYYPPFHQDALIPVQYLKPDTKDFFPVREAGWYRFKVVAYAVRNEGNVMRLQVSYGSDNKEEIPTIAGVTQLIDAVPRDIEYRVYLQPNQRVQLQMLDGTGWLPGSRILEDESPAIAIRSIELEGPLIEQWPPQGHQVLLGNMDPADLNDAAVPPLLHNVAPKLFRRPIPASALEEFVAFYEAHRVDLSPFDAFKLTVKAMMTSPLFLFHQEPAGHVDNFALANRLSYFLWRSMPDDELLDIASQGRLTQPLELQKQTDRLLAHVKSNRFLKDFVGQWLQITKVGEMQPDKGLYPEYDEELERAMVRETELFIRELLVHDLSLSNLIDSEWTMLNDRLARHYGIPGVMGNEFRKVKLDKSKTVRGGLLTQASILSITSNGTTTSPVVRGVWLLEHLLGTPAPPPPPDVPPIEPDIRGATTIQEQLAKHRSIAQCATCHRKIDPYGLALENFDVIGGWRENYRALITGRDQTRAQLGEGKPVTAAAELPKLGAYKSFTEFRTLLGQNEGLVFNNMAEKLTTFALGRSITFVDRRDIDAIVKTTQANGGGLRTMVMSLVQSPIFQRP